MRTRTLLSAALLALFAFPPLSQAQTYDEPEMGPLSGVSTWEVNPADMGKFVAAVDKVVKAAKEANLPPAYGWTMWQKGFTVAVVGGFMEAELKDPQHWVKQFMGTPGEATLMAAFQDFEQVEIMSSHSEIHQEMPQWNYTPEGMTVPPMKWVRVIEFWPRGGMENEQKWNALIGDFMTFFKDIGYAYPIWGNTVRYGENRHMFVVAYDNPAEYLGVNSVESIAMKHGKMEQWQNLLMRLSPLIRRSDSNDWEYMGAQSYTPEMTETGGSQ